MITLKQILPVVITVLLLSTTNAEAQRGRGHGGGGRHAGGRHMHRGAKVIIKPSPFRPAKVVVYRPMWGPKYYFNRRWVYFPKYNIYWDNWRNHYMYWNGSIWFSQPTPPPVIVNVNLENEKHYELKESEDDTDDVYKTNESHKTEYKPE